MKNFVDRESGVTVSEEPYIEFELLAENDRVPLTLSGPLPVCVPHWSW